MANERQVTRQVVIHTTPELAFEALSRASELREWFCDEARSDLRTGGRFEVRWNTGYRVEGRYTAVEAPRRVAFTWQGSGEPAETAVEATVEPLPDGVQVRLVHSGYGAGAEWDRAVSESEEGWSRGLENLQSTLETGIDLRWARRPFLGIHLDSLDPQRAEKEGIAADRGIYLTAVVEGSPARAAGLEKGDVIVALGGIETPGYNELSAALGAHQAGDDVAVEIVRGRARQTVQVILGQRATPEVPGGAEELGSRLAELYHEGDAAWMAALEGLSDEEAGRRPAAGEWSAKEVLIHLSIVERDQQCYLGVIALEGWLDTGLANPSAIPGRMAAVLSVDPALDDLVDRFTTDEAETVAFLRGLPDETAVHKARFRRIATFMLGLPEHTREHAEQIKATIAAVRG